MQKPEKVNVLAELERIGVGYHWAGDAEIKCLCPFHNDTSPSCNINTDKLSFVCHVAGCGAKGDFITFLARVLKTTRAVVFTDLSTRYLFDSENIVDPATVERYHQNIWVAKPLLQALYERGLTDEDIREYRLGEYKGRITIPITNKNGLYVNIRKYLPGAPGAQKMKNLKGRGKLRLFPPEQLQYPVIVVCGGECKAIVAARQLNKHNIGAVCATGGEGNFDISFLPDFVGKEVYVCLDIDEEGQKGANKICAMLYRTALATYNVVLPLDADKYPKGDINDYVGKEHRKLYPLLKKVKQWKPLVEQVIDDAEPEKIALVQAINAKVAGRRLEVKAVVASMDTAPYIIPHSVTVECDKSQNECILCPVFLESNPHRQMHHESPEILELMGTPKSTQREVLMRGLFIPTTCKVAKLTPTDYYNVEDCRISPPLEMTDRTADQIMQPAACIGNKLDLNEPYMFTGRMFPHPKTQQSTLLMSSYIATQDALSTYKCENLDELQIFQPNEWTVEGIQRVLDNIYEDVEANVTRIFQRRTMHLVVDLTYHSPLHIQFDGKVVKGWMESLIVGDSAQGKSEVCCGSEGNGGLMAHYRLGEKVECKNASVAGLLGGCQQVGNGRWFITWGIVPNNDKRLVFFEEVKGASTDVIAKLTDMRSSGIAEIPKIEKRRAQARCRQVWLSNPRGDRSMSTYNFGTEAIKELIGGLEDIRRFDLFYIVNRNDVDASELNKAQQSRPIVEHKFTSDVCRAMVLWAWTRTPEQISFEDSATAYVLETATELSNTYTDAVPIIDRGSARYKIARIAAALACRTFSHGEDKEHLLVRKCHVEYAVQLLKSIYNSHTFGYLDYTQAIKLTQDIVEPEGIKKAINAVPFPLDFINQMMHTSKIDLLDLQDWCSWDREQSQNLLSYLVRKRALQRDGRSYRKTPAFIVLLKKFAESDEIVQRPDFIEEAEF